MKKTLLVLGIMVLSASAFATNSREQALENVKLAYGTSHADGGYLIVDRSVPVSTLSFKAAIELFREARNARGGLFKEVHLTGRQLRMRPGSVQTVFQTISAYDLACGSMLFENRLRRNEYADFAQVFLGSDVTELALFTLKDKDVLEGCLVTSIRRTATGNRLTLLLIVSD